jgi:hypothetical protein
MKRLRFYLLLAASVASWSAVPAKAVQPAQPLLVANAITPGNWRIKAPGMPDQSLCLADILPLLQLQHPQPGCSRFTIADKFDRATVHYSCTGAGWGRTTVIVSTPRLVLIDTQGIARSEPFAYEAEARRTGDCEIPSRQRR